jgi:hypothetical protein
LVYIIFLEMCKKCWPRFRIRNSTLPIILFVTTDIYENVKIRQLKCIQTVEGYGGGTAYAGNVKAAARRETCAETFYDAF